MPSRYNSVLIATTDFPPMKGGISRWAEELAKGLEMNGRSVSIITPRATDSLKSRFRIIDDIPCVWTSFLPKNHSRLADSARETIKKNNVILAMHWQMAWGLLKVAEKEGVPVVIFAHGAEIACLHPIIRRSKGLKSSMALSFRKQVDYRIMRSVYSRCACIVCNSRFTEQRLRDRGIRNKTVINYPGVNLPGEDPGLNAGVPGDGKCVLSVGRLVERKGHDTAIRAVAHVVKELPDVKYIIVGEGPRKAYLKNLVHEMKIEKNVSFAGRVSDSRLAEYYRDCDLFILPSRIVDEQDYEGFGIVYLEANSYGKPVIGGKAGGCEDAIEDGVNGFLVDPLDEKELASVVLNLLKKDKLASEIGSKGLQRVKESFTWEKSVKRLIDAIEKI